MKNSPFEIVLTAALTATFTTVGIALTVFMVALPQPLELDRLQQLETEQLQPVDRIHPVYSVITSCEPLQYFDELRNDAIGVFSGVLDGDPAELYQGLWYVHVNITDSKGLQCRIELHADQLELFKGLGDGDTVHFVAGYDGRGTGYTAEGVGYPLHVFFLPSRSI